MISFWVDQPGACLIENYRKARGLPIADRFAVRVYQWQEPCLEVPAGPHIFSALDQLTDGQREAIGELYDQLVALQPGIRVLNDPRRCLLRPALLGALADAGLNSFRVYAVAQARTIERFPVFVREAHGHSGNLTPLLGSPQAVRRALRGLRLRGFRSSDLLIVEFCDTADPQGLFRKYAAFKVGDTVVAAHQMAGTHWLVKSENNRRSMELALEGVAYSEHNPHEAWIRNVFALAGIDYGRIDYGVLNGRPQAWEINLNPTIGRAIGAGNEPMDPEVAAVVRRGSDAWHHRLRQAFLALDTEAGGTPLRLDLEPGLLERIRREQRRAQGRQFAWSSLGKLYRHPRIGAPLRALAKRWFPLS